jgi:hypothetical protein
MKNRTTRLLGLLPLGFFVARLLVLRANGVLPDSLWVCNLSSLGLALGLLFDQPKVIRPAVLLLALGFPFWLAFVLGTNTYEVTSILNHAGSLAVGLLALARVRFAGAVWLHAFLAFFIIQQFSRFLTPPELNVNTAHNLRYTMIENSAIPYWQFWIGNMLLAALALYLLNRVFAGLFAEKSRFVISPAD